jgi:hypothetical protein
MAQILAKYNQGSIGTAEFADALLDPQNSFSYFQDFIVYDGASDYLVGTNSIHTTTTGTWTQNSAHGGTLTVSTAATSVANDACVVSSPLDLFELTGGRRAYVEVRFKSASAFVATGNWVLGLTAAAPATTVFSGGAVSVPVNSIMVGRDQGTDSLPGVSATAGRNIQLFTRDGTNTMVETACPLTETISNTAFMRVGFLCNGNTVQAFFNGKKVGSPVTLAAATSAAMGFYFAVQTTNTAAVAAEIDYIACAFTR